MNNELEKIKLSDILLGCLDFLQEPSKDNQEEMEALWNKIMIREYVPLEEKTKLILPIINQAQVDDENAVLMNMRIEIGKVFLGLVLGYCVNIENDLNIASLQVSLYDLIYSTGFVDWILNNGARKDYEKLCQMVDNSLNFSNILNLLSAFSTFDETNIKAFNDTIDSLKTELTSEKMDFLKKMTVVGTPEFEEFSKSLSETALKKVLGEKKIDENKKNINILKEKIEKIKQD